MTQHLLTAHATCAPNTTCNLIPCQFSSPPFLAYSFFIVDKSVRAVDGGKNVSRLTASCGAQTAINCYCLSVDGTVCPYSVCQIYNYLIVLVFQRPLKECYSVFQLNTFFACNNELRLLLVCLLSLLSSFFSFRCTIGRPMLLNQPTAVTMRSMGCRCFSMQYVPMKLVPIPLN
jgi:hypothetical protein